jgi:hypothetical protein
VNKEIKKYYPGVHINEITLIKDSSQQNNWWRCQAFEPGMQIANIVTF